MRGGGTSYPRPLLRLRRGVVVEMESHRGRCYSLVVVEAGVVVEHEQTIFHDDSGSSFQPWPGLDCEKRG
jgi:FAD/FMN-containing dehydrogenase